MKNIHELANALLELPIDAIMLYPDGNPVMSIVKDFTICSNVNQDSSMKDFRPELLPSTYVILNVR